ncbi:MAG TPA: NAD(P)(+) transhydrogenase (Re/Si-specific) subunit beta, partial [Candidatus Sumerlaeota bacterium]|nr:NAD(P)(+) transhydrogenase (Re/Si-specific) subunit beta [Candidatus Sumerlaeota bacterium]
MSATWQNLAYLIAAVLFILGLKGLAHPRSAPRGNLLGALGMLLAIVATLAGGGIIGWGWIFVGLAIGGVIGLVPVNAAYKYSARVAVSTTLYDKALDYSNAFVNLNRAIDIAKTRRSVEELLAHRPPLIRCDVEGLSFMQ